MEAVEELESLYEKKILILEGKVDELQNKLSDVMVRPELVKGADVWEERV